MTIEEMMKKWRFSIVKNANGEEGLKVEWDGKKPTEKQTIEIKSKKQEIIAAVKQQREERRAEMQKKIAQETEEYSRTADLRRCLVMHEDENYCREYYIATLVFVQKEEGLRAYQPEYGNLMKTVPLNHITPGMETIMQKASTQYGFYGAAWEISPKQEEELKAEQSPAAEKAAEEARKIAEEKARKEAEEKAKKELELQKKFDKARETGKPVVIEEIPVPCNDPKEECNWDNLVVYAMPDGTKKEKRYHTW